MKKFVWSMVLTGISVFSFAALAVVGCGSQDKLGGGGGGGGEGAIGGTVAVKLDGSSGSQGGGGAGGGGNPPNPDAACGLITKDTEHLPADVLLVLDRSGSMNESIAEECYCDASLATRDIPACSNTSNCSNRWATVTSALSSTMSATTTIRWGLKLYSSSGSGCTVSNTTEVPISATSAATISSKISSTSPGGNTPTAQAITAATNYLKTVTDPNNKVILLATDGEPNCASGGSSSPNVPATVAAITAAKDAGFLVYVIGMGPSVGNLDNFASAGGTGKYYPATSPADLSSALAAISTAVATCTFTSATPPPDPAKVWVYVDKQLLAKDPANGWSFGANNQTIVLNGSSCEDVKSGKSTNVQIVFGCGDSPPPTIP